MTQYFVYILYSAKYDLYYKGYTTQPDIRLSEHNNGFSRYTKGKGPWEMVYLELCESKTKALIREKQIKRYNHTYIKTLIIQATNTKRDA